METGLISKELKIATVGYGTTCNLVRQAINEAIERDTFISLLKAFGITEEEYKNQTNCSVILTDDFKTLADSINELQGIEPNEPTIEQLKKQIKYSKNPLEVKMLNKKLNQMYKERR